MARGDEKMIEIREKMVAALEDVGWRYGQELGRTPDPSNIGLDVMVNATLIYAARVVTRALTTAKYAGKAPASRGITIRGAGGVSLGGE